MRRITRATAAATVASLLVLGGLAACSGSAGDAATPSQSATSASTDAPEPTAADVAALDGVTVTGDAGAEPTLAFTAPLSVSVAVAKVTTEGTGDDLVEGQKLTLNYVAISGADNSTQATTYGATPDVILLGDESLIPALNTVLIGQKVGARILLAIPGQATAATDTATAAPAVTTLMSVEVASAKAIPTRAEGAAVTPPAGLPTVVLADDGAPTITPAEGDAPTTLVVQPLITGAGPAVTTGQSVTFQYTGALWDGTVFDSSWQNGSPFTTTIGTGSVIPGWDQGLVGQTVGSQVLLIVPPDLGYGDTETGSIPAGSTLVFVVDILDAS